MRLERRSMMPMQEGKKIRLHIPYNSVSTDMGAREVIAPGAFRRTLSDPNAEVLAFWNHDSSMVLGRRSAGTLDLDEDPEGLWAEVEEDEKSWSADARDVIKKKECPGSFVRIRGGSGWR